MHLQLWQCLAQFGEHMRGHVINLEVTELMLVKILLYSRIDGIKREVIKVHLTNNYVGGVSRQKHWNCYNKITLYLQKGEELKCFILRVFFNNKWLTCHNCFTLFYEFVIWLSWFQCCKCPMWASPSHWELWPRTYCVGVRKGVWRLVNRSLQFRSLWKDRKVSDSLCECLPKLSF